MEHPVHTYKVRYSLVRGVDDKTYAVMFTGTRDDAQYGEGMVAWTTRSGFVFPSADAAEAGAKRAVEQYEQDETFPNMCAPF